MTYSNKIQLKKILIGTVALSLLASFSHANERLILRDGKQAEADAFRFLGGKFLDSEGNGSQRAAVADWWLATKKAGTNNATEAESDSLAAKAMLDYRKRGLKTAAKFPGCRGVYVLDHGQYTLTNDLRHLYRYHFVGLIRNESLLTWSEISLGFTEGRSRQHILLARCLDTKGQVHTLDPNDISIGTPPRGSVHFDPNARMISGTIPGVEVGSIIEYIYEYESYSPEDWRLFFPGYYFQMDLPVCSSRFSVKVPAKIKLYFWDENWSGYGPKTMLQKMGRWLIKRNSGMKKTTSAENDISYNTFTWEKQDMAPIITEPNMPPWHEVAPAVHATVMGNWDHLNQLTGGMQLERMKVTPEINSLVEELTRECPTVEQKVAKLYHWVQKNIRYISVKSSLSSGWSGHPAAETLAQGYGDCTDKSVLFATMLQVTGVEAYPIVLRTNDRGQFFPKYPYLACNHCITEVNLQGTSLYLDCTTQNHRFPALRADDHGVLAFNFIKGNRRIIPVPPGMEASGKETHEQMQLDSSGVLQVQSRNSYAGGYEASLRGGWKRVPEKLRKQVMQQYLNGIAPGARLLDFTMPDPQNLNKQFTLDFNYRLPDYLSEAGSLRLFQFPSREKTFPEISLEKRRFPVVYTTAEALNRDISLQIPEGMTVVELPKNVEIRNQHVTYTEKYRIADREIGLHIFYERRSRRIPVSDYPDFRKTLQRIERITKRPIYLEMDL